jgi:hypothetical protein
LLPPEEDCFASLFLTAANAISVFEENGVKVLGRLASSAQLRHQKISAFETFADSASFRKYVDNLGDPTNRALLLHSETRPELLTSGHFHRIALLELLDNTFVHAGGRNSHYVAFESEAATDGRKTHPIFASFGGRGYIEICVGDSGCKNLVDTLRTFVPSPYEPTFNFEQRRKLDAAERCLLYAFEYGSTSKPKERGQRIAERFMRDVGTASNVATGLHEILSLAKFYGGQIIVRTAGRLGTIDFSDASNRIPRAAFWRNIRNRTLAGLRGTSMVLRVPLRRLGTSAQVTPKARIRSSASVTTTAAISIVTPSMSEGDRDGAETFLSIEPQLLEGLRLAASRHQLLALVLDGVRLNSKDFGICLELFARIPRNGAGLVVVTDDIHQVRVAAEQWEQTLAASSGPNEFLRQPSFVVAVDSENSSTLYGSVEHTDATTLLNGNVRVPSGTTGFPLDQIVTDVRALRIKEALQQPFVCHEGNKDTLYLIQSVYYTKKFYEVAKLLSQPIAEASVVMWLRHQIDTLKPTVIIYEAAFLESVLKQAMDPERLNGRRVQTLRAREDNVASTAVEASIESGKEGRVLVFIDVLCTGRFLNRFLQVFPAPERVDVLVLVDARDNSLQYFSVERRGRSIDVTIRSALKDRVTPIRDRPTDISFRDVLLIDRFTHAPTRYPPAERADADDSLLLRRAGEAGALAAGHFALEDRHYIYFLSFQQVYGELRLELENWLKEQIEELKRWAGVDLSKLRTYCLDESTGLFQSLERVLRENSLDVPRLITREQLSAPPALPAVSDFPAWFVLPAIVTGTSARSCLDFAMTLGASRVQLSVVAGRVEPDVSRFYRGLQRYREMDIRFYFMFFVPLSSYWEGQCPACALRDSFRAALDRIGNGRPHLTELLQATINQLEVVFAQSAGSVGLEKPAGSSTVWLEARAKGDYERARKDLEARSTLAKNLVGDIGEGLAETVGRVPSESGFTSGRLERFFIRAIRWLWLVKLGQKKHMTIPTHSDVSYVVSAILPPTSCEVGCRICLPATRTTQNFTPSS